MIGWLGLGRIGLPMAARVVKAGFELKGFDTDPARCTLAAQKGIRISQDMGNAELLFTSMPTEEALLELVKQLKGKALLVETSTIGPETSKRVSEIVGPYLIAMATALATAPLDGGATLKASMLTYLASNPLTAYVTTKVTAE